jgi:hypothetical protein
MPPVSPCKYARRSSADKTGEPNAPPPSARRTSLATPRAAASAAIAATCGHDCSSMTAVFSQAMLAVGSRSSETRACTSVSSCARASARARSVRATRRSERTRRKLMAPTATSASANSAAVVTTRALRFKKRCTSTRREYECALTSWPV